MCSFILLIIFIGLPILVNVSFFINFLIMFLPPKQINIKRLLKKLSNQVKRLERQDRVKIKVFDRL